MDERWCRRQYVVLLNREKEKVSILDNFEQRYQMLRGRVAEWAGVMDRLKKERSCRLVMITLTIRKVEDYSPGMIRDYVKKLKRQLGKKLYGFAWVAEMQKRGAVHYHMMVCVEKYTRIKIPDKSGMWSWGMSRIETARTPFYLCVYIGKERQKDLSSYPKSCRVYSVSYRLPEGQTKAYYELLKQKHRLEKELKDINKSKGWEYLGSTVTKGYAEKVLAPGWCDI